MDNGQKLYLEIGAANGDIPRHRVGQQQPGRRGVLVGEAPRQADLDIDNIDIDNIDIDM